MVWPEGVSNRIDSPWPTDSPFDTRDTGKPYRVTAFSRSDRSSSRSTLNDMSSMPVRGA